MVVKRRPRCRYRLDYLGRSYCKKVWENDLLAEAKELHFGCPNECKDYKADIYDVPFDGGVDKQ